MLKANERILKSKKNVMTLLNESIEDIDNQKENDRLAKDLWHISAELEYMASLISITSNLIDVYPNFKVQNDLSLKEIVTFAKKNLADIDKLITKNPKEKYEKIRLVIAYVRSAQFKLNSVLKSPSN
jgi:hypothetical protein